MRKVGFLAFDTAASGGTYQYTLSMLDALTGADCEVVVFVEPGSKLAVPKQFERREIDKAPRSLVMKAMRLLSILLGVPLPFTLSSKERLVCKDITFFISPAIKVFPHFFLNRDFAYTQHDMQYRYFPRFFSLKQRLSRFFVDRTLSSQSKAIICESAYVKSDIVKFLNVPEAKVHVIQAPPPQAFVEASVSEGDIEKIRAKYHLPTSYIFYPAQFWEHKNHLGLVEAFANVKATFNDVSLVLTGAKNNAYFKTFEKIESLGLKDSVLHLGYVAYEDLPLIYKASTCLVMPSLFESISIPVFEAFSLAVPVCASNVVAIPEQVGDAGVLFDPYQPLDIARAVKSLLADAELRASLGEKGRQKLLQFDHGGYGKSLGKLIKTV